MIVKAPCKDCADKVLYCHSTCEKYLDFTKKNHEHKENVRKQKYQENMMTSYIVEQTMKRKASKR